MSSLGQRLAADLIGRTFASDHLVAPLDFERDICADCRTPRNDHIRALRKKINTELACPTNTTGEKKRTFRAAPETLVVGVADESLEIHRALRLMTGYNVRFEVMSSTMVRTIIDEIFGPKEVISGRTDAEQMRDSIYEAAAQARASNIFLEYTVDENGDSMGRVRLDVLGDLRTIKTMSYELYDRLCGMLLKDSIDGTQMNRQVGQRGKLIAKADGREMNLRVSTYPIYHPDRDGIIKFAMRVLRRAEFLPTPQAAGLLPEQIETLCDLMDDEHCTILIGGPPGSGKSTTFYMLISLLPYWLLNIYGIEDPPEIFDPRITQTAVKPDQNWTIEEALREILRQQPRFAFVGELLDGVMADLFMSANRRAVPIGSTIHAEDALVIIESLRNFGIESQKIASGMTALASQRLVQHLCDNCRIPVDPNDRLTKHAQRHGVTLEEVIVYERGLGCNLCSMTGITGRTAVFEVVGVNEDMRRAIRSGSDDALVRSARQNGYITMLEHAIPLILEGTIAASSIRDFPESPALELALPLSDKHYLPRLMRSLNSASRHHHAATA